MRYHMVLDTETSGLPGNQHSAPIQVGVVVLNELGVEVHAESWLVMPRVIDTTAYRHAQAVHGISLARLESQAISAEASVERLKSLWLQYNRPLLYAYNSSFDELMITRMGWTPGGYWAPCLMRQAQGYLGLPKKVTLGAACSALSVQGPGLDAHDALADARAAAAVGRAVGAFV